MICHLIHLFLLFQMNTLYSMFAKQVQNYCKESMNGGDASHCKKNMMMYGVAKLNDMEESHLDTMDPYQRNAEDIRKSINYLDTCRLRASKAS